MRLQRTQKNRAFGLASMLLSLLPLAGCARQVAAPPDDIQTAIELKSSGRLDEALAILDKAVEDAAIQRTAFFQRAEIQRAKGNEALALADYSQIIRSYRGVVATFSVAEREAVVPHPLVTKALFQRGRIFLARKLPELARDDLSEVIRVQTDNVDAYCERARASLLLHSHRDAMEDCREAIRLRPDCAEAYALLGSTYFAMATAEYEKVGTPSPCEPIDATHLSTAAVPFDKALTYLGEAVRLDPVRAAAVHTQTAEGHFVHGKALYRAGRFAEAQVALDKAVVNDPGYAMKAQEYREPPRPSVIAQPEPQVELNIQEAEDHKRRGFACLDAGKFDQALEEFAAAEKLNLNSAEVFYGRGLAFSRKGFADTAASEFTQALLINPDYAEAYCQRGAAYAILKKEFLTIQDATEAIRIKPTFALAYQYRATAYLHDQHFDRAIADFQEAMHLDVALKGALTPLLADAYRGQGVVFLQQERWDDAIKHLNAAIQLKPELKEELSVPLEPGSR